MPRVVKICKTSLEMFSSLEFKMRQVGTVSYGGYIMTTAVQSITEKDVCHHMKWICKVALRYSLELFVAPV